MNTSSSDSDADNRLICRLCSNKTSLISLFKGKSRNVRDFIRKIVAVTIGVKYEEDSYLDCICFSCVIETYNFLVFKTKSLKNQERLQALVPKKEIISDSVTKLSDIELPNYIELKSVLTKWLFTKSFLSTESSESTDKSSNEGSLPSCTKPKVDKSIQTNAPKCFNVSIQTTFKQIIPKVSNETQTNLVEIINVGTQSNLTNEESPKPRIENKYTQCDLLKLKIEKTKHTGLFDVYTQTIDLKTENNNEAIIIKKCDSNEYNSVHKTLKNRIKHTSSDKIKIKKLKDKLKQHKSNRNIEDLFEPCKINKAAIGLEFTIKKVSTDSTDDSTDDNSSKLIEVSDTSQLNETITDQKNEQINDSSEDCSGKKLSPNSTSSKNNNLKIKETLSNTTKLPLNAKDCTQSESVLDKPRLKQSDESATSRLLKVVESITSQDTRKVGRTRSKLISQPEPKTSPMQIKESSPNVTKPRLHSTDLEKSDESATSELLKVIEPITSQDSMQDRRSRIKMSSQPEQKTSPTNNTSRLLKAIEPITSQDNRKVRRSRSKLSSQPEPKPQPTKNLSLPLTVDCQKPDLVEVKVEQDSPCSLVNLDTSIVLKSSPGSYDYEPSPTNGSPNSSGLLQKTGKVEYLKTCLECGRIIHTKNEMTNHRKSHMKCYLCKKRFKSIKKTKEHMNTDCIGKVDSANPTISLMKIEHCQNLTNQYPSIIGQITSSPKRRRKSDHPEEKCSKKKIVLQPSASSSK